MDFQAWCVHSNTPTDWLFSLPVPFLKRLPFVIMRMHWAAVWIPFIAAINTDYIIFFRRVQTIMKPPYSIDKSISYNVPLNHRNESIWNSFVWLGKIRTTSYSLFANPVILIWAIFSVRIPRRLGSKRIVESIDLSAIAEKCGYLFKISFEKWMWRFLNWSRRNAIGSKRRKKQVQGIQT